MDTKINITNQDGSVIEAELLRVFKNLEGTKRYVIYTLNEVDNNSLLKIYVGEMKEENGAINLVKIETDDEWNNIKILLRELIAGGNNE